MTTTAPTTATRAERVTAMIRDGYTVPQMADALGIETRNLRRWANHHRISLPKPDRDAERREAIAAMTDEGLTVPEMAARLGLKEVSTLRKWAGSRGIALPLAYDRAAVDAERLAAIDPDKTPQEIADKLGISRVTLVNWARDHDVELPDATEVHNRRRATAVRAMLEEGMDRHQIAKHLGLAVHTLNQWCAANDIRLPKPPRKCQRCRTQDQEPGRIHCTPCRDQIALKAALKAGTAHYRAVAFRLWTPPPSLYGGVSPDAVAHWYADCARCQTCEAADDEQHARELAAVHNLAKHPEAEAA